MKKKGAIEIVGKTIVDTQKAIMDKINSPSKSNKLNFRQKAADALSKGAGSWTFIILFFVFLGIWMTTNGIFVLKHIQGDLIDPYPFILLNLILSCLAAIQAPVILMSQNRAAQRDRLRAEYDYAVNRKAEKEIQEIKTILMKLKKAR